MGGKDTYSVPRSERRRRQLAIAVALTALGGMAVAAWLIDPPAKSTAPCTLTRSPARLAGIDESSGLALSRRHRDLMWTHNDSGNESVLFAIDAAGAVHARLRLPFDMRDWEDVSAARCGDTDCLYLADIGDNNESRDEVRVYRIPEPGLDDASSSPPQVFTVTYPDGPHNAEAAFILGADLFIVTRDDKGAVYRARLDSQGGPVAVEQHGVVSLAHVTDAETSRDGATVAIRTVAEVVLFAAVDLLEGRYVPSLRIPIGGLQEPQGEGVSLDGRTLYLTSEKSRRGPGGQIISLECDMDLPLIAP